MYGSPVITRNHVLTPRLLGQDCLIHWFLFISSITWDSNWNSPNTITPPSALYLRVVRPRGPVVGGGGPTRALLLIALALGGLRKHQSVTPTKPPAPARLSRRVPSRFDGAADIPRRQTGNYCVFSVVLSSVFLRKR